MRTTIKKLLCAVFLLLPYCGFSQSGYTSATTMDVNGVFIGGTYTKTQVEAKWGTATLYQGNTSELGVNETYHYNPNNLFRFSDNGIFNSFYIRTSSFIVYAAFSGGIKVGDNISRISAIGLGTPVLQSDGTYHLRRNNSTDPLVFKHSNGVITEISFVTSI